MGSRQARPAFGRPAFGPTGAYTRRGRHLSSHWPDANDAPGRRRSGYERNARRQRMRWCSALQRASRGNAEYPGLAEFNHGTRDLHDEFPTTRHDRAADAVTDSNTNNNTDSNSEENGCPRLSRRARLGANFYRGDALSELVRHQCLHDLLRATDLRLPLEGALPKAVGHGRTGRRLRITAGSAARDC